MSYPHRLAVVGQIMTDILTEREAQLCKWGDQRHPDGTGYNTQIGESRKHLADLMRYVCDRAHKRGELTWRHILDEEMAEAAAETDPKPLRKELIQVVAVCVAWIEDIDRRLSNVDELPQGGAVGGEAGSLAPSTVP